MVLNCNRDTVLDTFVMDINVFSLFDSPKGRLWIHAAGKVPDAATIKAMEDFYREIYAVNGISDIKFPEHYPVSKLLGHADFPLTRFF